VTVELALEADRRLASIQRAQARKQSSSRAKPSK